MLIGQACFPIRDVLHHHQNVTFHQAVVTSIDTTAKEVTMDSMASLTRCAFHTSE